MDKQNTATVTDARGRTIEIRRLKPLEKMHLLELIGPDNSSNDRYVGYASLAFCVNSIDGNPIGRLGTKLALEAVVKELDEDGFDAVAKGASENFVDEAKDQTALKNV